MRVRGCEYLNLGIATGGFSGPFDYGEDLPPNGSLGQSFTIEPGRDCCTACGYF